MNPTTWGLRLSYLLFHDDLWFWATDQCNFTYIFGVYLALAERNETTDLIFKIFWVYSHYSIMGAVIYNNTMVCTCNERTWTCNLHLLPLALGSLLLQTKFEGFQMDFYETWKLAIVWLFVHGGAQCVLCYFTQPIQYQYRSFRQKFLYLSNEVFAVSYR